MERARMAWIHWTTVVHGIVEESTVNGAEFVKYRAAGCSPITREE
jgi:hypothetical protein